MMVKQISAGKKNNQNFWDPVCHVQRHPDMQIIPFTCASHITYIHITYTYDYFILIIFNCLFTTITLLHTIHVYNLIYYVEHFNDSGT